MKLLEQLNRVRFNWAVRALCNTPPLAPGHAPFVVLSMVQHRDVRPYLLAIKSFVRFLSPHRIVLVADPSLNQTDRVLLKHHIPHIEFRDAAEFHRDGIPRGGCWERLNAIAEYGRNTYVVQLDADTVSTKDLPEVRQAILDKVCFTLGTENVQPILASKEIAREAQKRLTEQSHAQLRAEAALDRFDTTGRFRYARGCAGFSGFSPGSVNPALVQEISCGMASALGTSWSAWGTEQFTSNLLVCSSPGARMLPHPLYCHPGRMTSSTKFLHFIGYVRYQSALYAQLARQLAQELSAANSGNTMRQFGP